MVWQFRIGAFDTASSTTSLLEGSAGQIGDDLHAVARHTGVDELNVSCVASPDSCVDLVELSIPEWQRLGTAG